VPSWRTYSLALSLYGLCSFFVVSLLQADPRNPLPETPSQVWQNDLDLRDMINSRISLNGSGFCIDSPTFCVDADNNRVAIGTTTISNLLDIKNSSNSDIFQITDDGEITQPLQPSFLVLAPTNTQDVTGDGTNHTVEFDTEIKDLSGDFNTGTFTFTAPVAGSYQFDFNVQLSTGSAHTDSSCLLTTSNRTYFYQYIDSITDERMYPLGVLADMDASDTVSVVCAYTGGVKQVEVENSSGGDNRAWFSGSLIN